MTTKQGILGQSSLGPKLVEPGKVPEPIDLGLTAVLIGEERDYASDTRALTYQVSDGDLKAKAEIRVPPEVEEMGEDVEPTLRRMVAAACRRDLLAAVNRVHFEIGGCYRETETGNMLRIVGHGEESGGGRQMIAEFVEEKVEGEYVERPRLVWAPGTSALGWIEVPEREWNEALGLDKKNVEKLTIACEGCGKEVRGVLSGDAPLITECYSDGTKSPSLCSECWGERADREKKQ